MNIAADIDISALPPRANAQNKAINLIEACSMFARWSLADKNRLAQRAREFDLAPGETLYERDDSARGLYLVYSGCVKVAVMTDEGDEAIIDVVGNGQWFGELSIIDGLTRQHSAIALEQTSCIVLDNQLIESVLTANPSLHREFSLLISKRLRDIFLWMEESLLNSVGAQIVKRLQHIAMSVGTSHEDGVIIRALISQDMLAAMLGITRQTLNKELGALKQEGLIKKIGRYYWIKSAATFSTSSNTGRLPVFPTSSFAQHAVFHCVATPCNKKGAWAQHYVDNNPLFGRWTPADRERLALSVQEFHLAPGQTLFERGACSKRLYFVIAGSLKGAVQAEDGSEAIIDVGAGGQWFGGLGIIDKQPSRQSVIALEETHCIAFSGTVIESVLEQNPELYREISYLLCERLRAVFAQMETSLLKSIQDRVLTRLQRTALDAGTPHDGGYTIHSRISQDVLAGMLGITRQTLNKVLGQLKQSGLVRKIGNRYWVSMSPTSSN